MDRVLAAAAAKRAQVRKGDGRGESGKKNGGPRFFRADDGGLSPPTPLSRQAAAARATAMDADKPAAAAAGPSSAAAAGEEGAKDTADVSWSKLGVARGGVGPKRRSVRGRGKGRPPRRYVGEADAKAAALHFGSANPKRKGGPGKRRVSIFNPTRQ
jgi:hypothetical protein